MRKLAYAAVTAALLTLPGTAVAATPTTAAKAVLAYETRGEMQCKDVASEGEEGHVMDRRFHRCDVRYSVEYMAPCKHEDASGRQKLPCFWNAATRGNGVGHSFYATRDKTRTTTGRCFRYLADDPWAPVRSCSK